MLTRVSLPNDARVLKRKWTAERARDWYAAVAPLQGCNYVPSTAVNSLDMWQAGRFDAGLIDCELALAAGLGMNTARVFLHDLAHAADPAGFLRRVDAFLTVCARHGIRPLLVFFDDCWDAPAPGPQPAPIPGVHNSRWIQSPGVEAAADPAQRPRLEAYVRDVVRAFGRDERVLAWDVYNEVTNFFLRHLAKSEPMKSFGLVSTMVRRRLGDKPTLALAGEACAWIRDEGTDHPLTLASWYTESWLNEQLYAWSDVISFHSYEGPEAVAALIDSLQVYERPILCTEWLSRPAGSTVEAVLPVLRKRNVGSYNWGLVDGATQVKYGWADDGTGGGGEPELWFSDLLRADGTAYREAEAAVLRAGR